VLLSLGEIAMHLSANPRPWDFKWSRSLKRKNEQLLDTFLHTSYPRGTVKSSSGLKQAEGATFVLTACS